MNPLITCGTLLFFLHASFGVAEEIVAVRCEKLVQRLLENPAPISHAEQLEFTGVGSRDVYNPTAPFEILIGGRKRTVMAARVEPRDKENAQVMFFQRKGKRWSPISGAPVFDMQDPFVTRIGKETVFGGVSTFPKPEGGLGYKTVFYRMQDLMKLKGRSPKVFAEGPVGMKDIRLIALPKGEVLVATRPQGKENGPGRIGFTILKRLEELTPQTVLEAKILPHLFAADEWGGANEMHLLKDGRVGVLGHIARFDENTLDGQKVRHYYPMTFVYDPKTGTHTEPKILLQRSDFDRFGLTKDSKRKDLVDVLFSGGLIRNPNGSATLYVGAGDAKVVKIELEKDPFR